MYYNGLPDLAETLSYTENIIISYKSPVVLEGEGLTYSPLACIGHDQGAPPQHHCDARILDESECFQDGDQRAQNQCEKVDKQMLILPYEPPKITPEIIKPTQNVGST